MASLRGVSQILAEDHGIAIRPGAKGECPSCNHGNFSLKDDDSLGKCFHPSCGHYLTRETAHDGSGLSRVLQALYRDCHQALLSLAGTSGQHAYRYLVEERAVHPQVVADAMLGVVPSDCNVAGYFQQPIQDAQHALATLKAQGKKGARQVQALDRAEQRVTDLQTAQQSLHDCFAHHAGWLIFFYTDSAHRLVALRLREPYSKKFVSFKRGIAGVFGRELFTPYRSPDLQALNEHLLVVEGEFNVLALQSLTRRYEEVTGESLGYLHACAVGGVQIADVETVRRSANHPTVWYDHDANEAGWELVKRLQQGMNVDACTAEACPSDPDSFVQSFAPDVRAAWNAVQAVIQSRKPSARPYNPRYCVIDHELMLRAPDLATGQERLLPLTNFDAVITTEVTRDDGADIRRAFVISTTISPGTAPRTCEVPAEEFARLEWVTAHLGAGAILEAGQGTRDHARCAIQHLSPPPVQRHIFEHTGWRTLADGTMAYLHGTGALTAAGARQDVHVELSGTLARYALPEPADDATTQQAIQHSLALVDLLDKHAMAAPLGAAYLAPLRPWLPHAPPDFIVWLTGPTGTYKSEAAALALNHFGASFSRATLPGSFTATANALERLCFATKDALTVIDDYHPATNRREADALSATVSRLLRSVGNGTGRARMRADTTARPDLPPRGVVLCTAERLPEGHSTSARLFLADVDQPQDRAATAARLTAAQAHRAAYGQAMTAYLSWLAQQTDRLEQELPARFQTLRTAAQQQTSGMHGRQAGAIAHLMLAWEVFTAFACELYALTVADRHALLCAVWVALLATSQEHATHLASLAPHERFLSLLQNGLAGKRCYLESLNDGEPMDAAEVGWIKGTARENGVAYEAYSRPAGGALVGYVDEDWCYLLPEAVYQYVASAARQANEVFPVGSATLAKHLDEAGWIATEGTGSNRRRQVQQRIQGSKLRVWKLQRSVAHGLVPGIPGTASLQGTAQHPIKSVSYDVVPGVPGFGAPRERVCSTDYASMDYADSEYTHVYINNSGYTGYTGYNHSQPLDIQFSQVYPVNSDTSPLLGTPGTAPPDTSRAYGETLATDMHTSVDMGAPPVAAGAWVHLLSADGVQQEEAPAYVERIDLGSDGQLYAILRGKRTGWLLAHCERTAPLPTVLPSRQAQWPAPCRHTFGTAETAADGRVSRVCATCGLRVVVKSPPPVQASPSAPPGPDAHEPWPTAPGEHALTDEEAVQVWEA